MPTYEYGCTNCGHNFEIFQNINAQPLNKCPKCAKEIKRLIGSGSGIIFKGSGFYATDYRKKSSAKNPAPACPKAKEGCDGCKPELNRG